MFQRTAAAILFLTAAVSAQPAYKLSHPLAASAAAAAAGGTSMQQPRTIRILAAMVEFQRDNDPRTTGDGGFDLTTRTDSIIGPPPHDQSYFEAHLQFASNYYRKVSDGKIALTNRVLDRVITLAKQMRTYAPPVASSNLQNLARLPVDVWTQVDSIYPDIDFSSYDLFLIFHAGAGHDVNFYGAVDLDPTPYDLPSLYMGLPSFRSAFGSSYMGIPVRRGSYRITNSVIMPETESRLVEEIGGSILLQFSMNGILCGNIGSFLGLPDLFDTKTGASGIGRFGLMDGASMFSFNGLFPPEPSAWEKVRLGLQAPQTVSSSAQTYLLPAHEAGQTPVMLRVPISSREYFLVENRSRDPRRNGVTLTLLFNGKTETRHFARDTAGFNSDDVGKIYGVVLDVDNFDWSLPGGVGEDGTFYDGGILIWHIDENVIDANSSSNSVNADPHRRGVNLMEADGSQDIGQSYDLLSAGLGSEYGTAIDYWYAGNPSPVNKNEFSPTSNPNSLSYGYLDAGIVVNGFSSRGPVMSCTVKYGTDTAKPLAGFPLKIGALDVNAVPVAADLTGDGSPEVLLNAAGRLLAFDKRGIISDSTGVIPQRIRFVPAVNASRTLVAASADSGVVFVRPTIQEGMLRSSATFVKLGSGMSTSPMFLGDTAVVGDSSGTIHFATAAGALPDVRTGLGPVLDLASAGTGWIGVCSHGYIQQRPGGLDSLRVLDEQRSAAAANLAGGGVWLFVHSVDGRVARRLLFARPVVQKPHPDQLAAAANEPKFPNPYIGTLDPTGHITLLDYDGGRVTGSKDGELLSMNTEGATSDGFPVHFRTGSVSSSPVAGLLNDKRGVLLVGDSAGVVHVVDDAGKELSGFPVGTGGAVTAPVTLAPDDSGSIIFASSSDGYLYAWRTTLSVQGSGAQFLVSPAHENWTLITPVSAPLAGSPVLVASRTYNWPNPLYTSSGYIRFFLNADASVSIKVYDLSGFKVQELTAFGRGGMDNEIPWDVSGLGSGVYIVRVSAASGSRTDNTTFKAAIVR